MSLANRLRTLKSEAGARVPAGSRARTASEQVETVGADNSRGPERMAREEGASHGVAPEGNPPAGYPEERGGASGPIASPGGAGGSSDGVNRHAGQNEPVASLRVERSPVEGLSVVAAPVTGSGASDPLPDPTTSVRPVSGGNAGEALARLRRLTRVRQTEPRVIGGETVEQLATRLDARVESPGLVVREETFGLPRRVGQGGVGSGALASVPVLEREPRDPPGRLLVFDTETTGLAGGTGTVPFLLGLLIVDADGARLMQWLMTRFDGEPAALAGLSDAVGDFDPMRDALVTFNGSSFDLPLLETRARLAGTRSPFEDVRHLDLVHVVRRAYGGRWSDCRQQTAEQRLLAQRRVDDLPGADVPERWFGWMRSGDGAGLVPVVEHNRLDLLGLAALIAPMADVYADPVARGARVLSTLGARAPEHELRAYLQNHKARLDVNELLEFARLAKRAGDLEAARATLESLVAKGSPDARLQLAKLLEHQLGQLDRALALTRELVSEAPQCPAVRAREARLVGKIALRGLRTPR